MPHAGVFTYMCLVPSPLGALAGSVVSALAGSWAQLAPDPQLVHNKVTWSLGYGSTLFPSIGCYLIIGYKPKRSQFY